MSINNKYVDVKIKEHCDIFDEEEIKAITRGNIVSFAFENYWIFFCPMCGKELEVFEAQLCASCRRYT